MMILRNLPGGVPVKIWRNRPVSDEIAGMVARAYRLNRRLFGSDAPAFDFIICDDDFFWKKESREYFVPWAKAVVLRNGTVVIRFPSGGVSAKAEFSQLARHEINHVFWRFLHMSRRERWCPFWLAEGLACHIAGSRYRPPAGALARLVRGNSVMRLLPYRYRAGFLRSREDLTVYYAFWSSFTGALISAHGAAVVRLILCHAARPGQASFMALCKRLLGQPLEVLLREFIRTQAGVSGEEHRAPSGSFTSKGVS